MVDAQRIQQVSGEIARRFHHYARIQAMPQANVPQLMTDAEQRAA